MQRKIYVSIIPLFLVPMLLVFISLLVWQLYSGTEQPLIFWIAIPIIALSILSMIIYMKPMAVITYEDRLEIWHFKTRTIMFSSISEFIYPYWSSPNDDRSRCSKIVLYDGSVVYLYDFFVGFKTFAEKMNGYRSAEVPEVIEKEKPTILLDRHTSFKPCYFCNPLSYLVFASVIISLFCAVRVISDPGNIKYYIYLFVTLVSLLSLANPLSDFYIKDDVLIIKNLFHIWSKKSLNIRDIKFIKVGIDIITISLNDGRVYNKPHVLSESTRIKFLNTLDCMRIRCEG